MLGRGRMTTYQLIAHGGPDFLKYLITELVHRDNAKFLPPRLSTVLPGAPHLHYLVAPSMASGSVISNSMIDGLLLHTFLGRPDSLTVFHLLCGLKTHTQYEHDAQAGLRHQALTLVDVPDELLYRPQPPTFGMLFRLLVTSYRVLPLGLYRDANRTLGNRLPFVYTSPLHSTVVLPTDRVYVLSSEDDVAVDKAGPTQVEIAATPPASNYRRDLQAILDKIA
jgi:hypothetical protein